MKNIANIVALVGLVLPIASCAHRTPDVVFRNTLPPRPPLVWVNTATHIYHYPGTRWYGKTRQGRYETEAQARAEGDRAALNGE